MIANLSYEPTSNVEVVLFNKFLELVNPSRSIVLNEFTVAAFLARSELSRDVLRNIWTLAVGKKTSVKTADFFTMLHAVAIAQAGLPLNGETFNSKNCEFLPKFTGLEDSEENSPVPRRQSAVSALSCFSDKVDSSLFSNLTQDGQRGDLIDTTTDQSDQSPGQWTVTAANYSQYRELFHKQPLSDGKLSGKDAVAFFLQSKLDRADLRQIWNLADIDKDGNLNEEEFCIAMNIIMCRIRNGVKIPKTLPAELTPPSMRKSFEQLISSQEGDSSNSGPRSIQSRRSSVGMDRTAQFGTARQLAEAGDYSPSNMKMQTLPANDFQAAGYSRNNRNPSLNYSSPPSNDYNTAKFENPAGLTSRQTMPMRGSMDQNDGAGIYSNSLRQSCSDANSMTASCTASIQALTSKLSLQHNTNQKNMTDLASEGKSLATALEVSAQGLGETIAQIQSEQEELNLLRAAVSEMQGDVHRQNEALTVEKDKLNMIRVERLNLQNQLTNLYEYQEKLHNESQHLSAQIQNEKNLLDASSSMLVRMNGGSHSDNNRSNQTKLPAMPAVNANIPEIVASPDSVNFDEMETPDLEKLRENQQGQFSFSDIPSSLSGSIPVSSSPAWSDIEVEESKKNIKNPSDRYTDDNAIGNSFHDDSDSLNDIVTTSQHDNGYVITRSSEDALEKTCQEDEENRLNEKNKTIIPITDAAIAELS